ncbi:hypothetical protein AMS68_002781 [Peltaster fructicola]|uniref:Uncharacterized protein n=1 Tax=Peltaster fructicola TaxID=286661 RepID=A0A6H0XRA5_9PEZI|nr:hypothetical protein AMS68_002781 [Peltaster fructicola]
MVEPMQAAGKTRLELCSVKLQALWGSGRARIRPSHERPPPSYILVSKSTTVGTRILLSLPPIAIGFYCSKVCSVLSLSSASSFLSTASSTRSDSLFSSLFEVTLKTSDVSARVHLPITPLVVSSKEQNASKLAVISSSKDILQSIYLELPSL